MSREPIQVPSELKKELQKLKKQLHCKSFPDVIKQLIDEREMNIWLRKEEQKHKDQENERIKREFVHLGAERKNKLVEFQKGVGLTESEAIDFLIDVFNSTSVMGMDAFKSYVKLRR